MPEPLEVRPHHLAGLCLVTESNRPSEWPAILQVILNRVVSRRYPDTVEEVILQRMQFSRFNDNSSNQRRLQRKNEIYRHVASFQVVDPLLLAHAQDFARERGADRFTRQEGKLLGWGRICPDISPETLHYYSPVSMVPKGSAPAWAPTAKRLYTPPGIDPDRFVFAEAVK